MPARLPAAAAAALLALVSSCSFARSGETRERTAVEDRQVGNGVVFPTTTVSTTPPPTGGPAGSEKAITAIDGSSTGEPSGFAITILGPDGRPRPGVPAKVTGPVNGSATSDIDGVLRFPGPAGRYVASIVPTCTDTVQVQTAATGRIAVPEGEVVQGELRVAARRRHFPGGPVTWAAQNKTAATERRGRQWQLGVTYLVKFTMLDRCASDAAAPNAPIDGLRFVTDGALEARVQESTTARPDGTALVAAICQAEADEIQLFAEDQRYPEDRVDLFSRALLDDTAPNCVRE